MPLTFNGLNYYTLREVSANVQLSVTTLKGYIHSDRLPARKIGKRWVVAERDVENLLEKGTAQ